MVIESPTYWRTVAITLVVAVGMALTGGSHPAASQPAGGSRVTTTLVYSVEFACGIVPGTVLNEAGGVNAGNEPPVKPGNYATAITVHNFRNESIAVEIRESISTATADGLDVRVLVEGERSVTIDPHSAVEFDCADITATVDCTGADGGTVRNGVHADPDDRAD